MLWYAHVNQKKQPSSDMNVVSRSVCIIDVYLNVYMYINRTHLCLGSLSLCIRHALLAPSSAVFETTFSPERLLEGRNDDGTLAKDAP